MFKQIWGLIDCALIFIMIILDEYLGHSNLTCDERFNAKTNMSSHQYTHFTGPRSAVCNVSGNRCESDCRSRGCELGPGSVPYFCGDWSRNNFYCHSPPCRWIIQEGLLSVTSESMCTKYWLTACSSLPRKKYG